MEPLIKGYPKYLIELLIKMMVLLYNQNLIVYPPIRIRRLRFSQRLYTMISLGNLDNQ